MVTIRKTYRLTEETLAQIDAYADKHGLNNTQALASMIDTAHKMQMESDDVIAKKVIDAFDEKYKNLFTRLRLGVRASDLNSQIMLELLNTILVNMSIQEKDVVLTDKFTNPALRHSTELVKNRLAAAKQRKDYKKKQNPGT